MKTTLKKLREIYFDDWGRLIDHLGTKKLDTEVSILQILDICGIKNAISTLITQDYKDYCLFNADLAESVLHLFENEYPYDKRPRKAIEGIRLYHAGKITEYELIELKNNACVAAHGAGAYTIVYYAANAAGNAANAAGYCDSAARSVFCAHTFPYHNSDEKIWGDVEVLLRKHLNPSLLDDDLFRI